MIFKDLYDDQLYKQSLLASLKALKDDSQKVEGIVYIIKNIITLNNFKVPEDNTQMKKLCLYYFFQKGSADFSNDYSVLFDTSKLNVNLKFFQEGKWQSYTDFKQYFVLGKNEIFVNKMKDISIQEFTKEDEERGVLKVENLVDFFIVFLHENFELYSMKGEYFPLFKWLINELSEEEEHHS